MGSGTDTKTSSEPFTIKSRYWTVKNEISLVDPFFQSKKFQPDVTNTAIPETYTK